MKKSIWSLMFCVLTTAFLVSCNKADLQQPVMATTSSVATDAKMASNVAKVGYVPKPGDSTYDYDKRFGVLGASHVPFRYMDSANHLQWYSNIDGWTGSWIPTISATIGVVEGATYLDAVYNSQNDILIRDYPATWYLLYYGSYGIALYETPQIGHGPSKLVQMCFKEKAGNVMYIIPAYAYGTSSALPSTWIGNQVYLQLTHYTGH